MAYSDTLEAIMNGIDVVENLANGARDGAGAYWEDAEAFFRRASWDLLFDQEAAEHPFEPWELSYDPELPPPPPRPDIW